MLVTSDTEALIADSCSRASCSPPRRPWSAAWGRAAKLVAGTALAVLLCTGTVAGARRGRSFLAKADSSPGPAELEEAPEALDVEQLYGTASYECYDELSNWRSSWSEHKKQWCCTHEHQGCEGGAHGYGHPYGGHYGHHYEARPFDCSAAYGNREAAWSEPKKNYCCRAYNLGCVSVWEAHKTLWIVLITLAVILAAVAIGVLLYRKLKAPPPAPPPKPKPAPAPPKKDCTTCWGLGH